jgi:hypothetical protein
MAHRVFTDSAGRTWDVWTVTPSRAERRLNPDPEWEGSERRRTTEYRILLGGEWVSGWLAFETAGEKRRLAPYPENWAELTAAELEALCARAIRVKPSRRLVE